MVKCIDTGEKIDKDSAFVIYGVSKSGKKTTKYFSSEEGYRRFETNKEYRNKIINKYCELLGYKTYKMIPTLFYKEMENYKDNIGFDTLYETLCNKTNDIIYALSNKDFGSETAKTMYIFGIVKNHCMEYYRKKVAYQRMNNNIHMDSEINVPERRQAVRDISRWLDD